MATETGPRADLRTTDAVDEPASVAVVRAVAAAADEDPTEMDPLYEAVDPDALDALWAPPGRSTDGSTVTVEFPFNGYLIRLSDDGELSVFDLD